jgi:muramoyltetrapeptide carboxypeptidase
MIVPSTIRRGDRVGIIAPSRKIIESDLTASFATLRDWGLNVVTGKNIFSSSHSYLAGSDEERRQDFQNFIDDAEIKLIIAARGGYGSTRIIDSIDFTPMIASPKWIVGFSDITAVHLKLYALGIVSIHGTMPILFSREDSKPSIKSLQEILFSAAYSIHAPVHDMNRIGKSSGKVIGGNLSLVIDSLGTTSEPDTEDCILVLEEIDEYGYRVDRMMTQLKRAGKLSGLKGLVVGHFTDMKDSELPFGEDAFRIIQNAVHEYGYPVAFGFPTGHQNPNLAWAHGGEATFSVTEAGATLTSSFPPS